VTQYTHEGYRSWYDSTCSNKAGIYVTSIYRFSFYLTEHTKFVDKIHIIFRVK